MGVGKFFKDAGHSISKGSKSIGHVFESGAKKVVGGVSDVYKDGKSAVAYTGKHLIKDVDNVSNALSNPMLWVVVGGVVILVLTRR